jgi:protein-L-isoaspartate(D-aspartate) O-methyltransferase
MVAPTIAVRPRHLRPCLILIVLCMLVFPESRWSSAQVIGQGSPQDRYAPARQRLVNEVLRTGGITNPRVLDAVGSTPRHEFVPQEFLAQAYFDKALPIGASQTISSPYIVAVMTQELDPQPAEKVLEIGTGSGYQAAVLSPLVQEVYTIEIVEELGVSAERLLKRLGYTNVHVKVGDGFKGWEEHAPFDKIIVTCSPEDVPQPLIDQLKDGGLMIIPVGERYQQTLMRMRKRGSELEQEALRPTLFVPMTGAAEDQRKVKADPTNPQLVNGDFEDAPLESGDVPGWYYQRGLTWKSGDGSPSGGNHVEFRNDVSGRPTTLLQGFAIDGSVVKRLRVTAQVRTSEVVVGQERDELPAITIQFFDDKRQRLAVQWLGPYSGTRRWKEESRTFRVPPETREAIISLGLFGATGTVAFDNVRIEGLK